MRIYIDDTRKKPFSFDKIFLDAESFLEWYKNNPQAIEVLSLDHDLGLNKMTGYDLVKEIVSINPTIKAIYIHSANPIGFKNMLSYLNNAKRVGVIENIKYIAQERVEWK